MPLVATSVRAVAVAVAVAAAAAAAEDDEEQQKTEQKEAGAGTGAGAGAGDKKVADLGQLGQHSTDVFVANITADNRCHFQLLALWI